MGVGLAKGEEWRSMGDPAGQAWATGATVPEPSGWAWGTQKPSRGSGLAVATLTLFRVGYPHIQTCTSRSQNVTFIGTFLNHRGQTTFGCYPEFTTLLLRRGPGLHFPQTY